MLTSGDGRWMISIEFLRVISHEPEDTLSGCISQWWSMREYGTLSTPIDDIFQHWADLLHWADLSHWHRFLSQVPHSSSSQVPLKFLSSSIAQISTLNMHIKRISFNSVDLITFASVASSSSIFESHQLKSWTRRVHRKSWIRDSSIQNLLFRAYCQVPASGEFQIAGSSSNSLKFRLRTWVKLL